MKKFIVMAAVAALFVTGCQKQEPAQKIAVINMAKVFASHPALALINPQVNAQKGGVQQKVQKAAKVISAKQEALKKIAADKEIELEKKQKLAKEINSDKAKLNKFVQQKSQQIGAIQKSARDQLLITLVKLVNDYRAEKDYSFVLDYSGMTGNNMAAVVCFDKENDITEDILTKVKAIKVSVKKKEEKKADAKPAEEEAAK